MTQHNGQPSPPSAVARDAGQVAQEVVELAELHAALLKLEAERLTKKVTVPVVLLIASGLLTLCCLVVLLMSAGHAVAELTTLPLSVSLLISGAGGIVLAAILAGAGWLKWKAMQDPFSESKREFRRNVHWFKTVLREARRPSTAVHSR